MADTPHIIFLIVAFIVVGTATVGAVSAAPWLPTLKRCRKTLLDELLLRGDERICDLGCGDGSVVFDIAEKYPNCRASGVEIFVLPYLTALIRKFARSRKFSNTNFYFGNLFRHDISNQDVILVFLMEKSYSRLMRKFGQELSDDSLVVVEAWPFKGIEPERVIRKTGELPFYFYRGRQFRKA